MSDFKTILALDTTMSGIGAGLYARDGAVNAGEFRESLRGQAELLVPMAKDLIAAHDVAFADLDAIVVPLGPGTFTGVRICLSAAKAFGMALGVPVLGISTLQALALQYVDSGESHANIAVLIETKRSDFYIQCFAGDGKAVNEAAALEMDAAEALYDGQVLIGDAVKRFGREQDARFERIDVAFLARLLVERPEAFSDVIEPIYLRGADVSKPKVAPRVLA